MVRGLLAKLAWGFWLLMLAGCQASETLPLPQISHVQVEQAQVRGVVAVSYRLADTSGFPLQINVEYKLDNEAWAPASSAGGSGDGVGVLADGERRQMTFLWDSYRDAGTRGVAARLRVTAINPEKQAYSESGNFWLANDNLPPQLAFVPVEALEEGELPVTIALVDAESEPVSLELHYSYDGGEHYLPATVDGQLAEIETTPNAGLHTLSWQAGTDLGWLDQGNVRLRAVAADALGQGNAVYSDALSISFSLQPGLKLSPLPRTLREEVAVVLYVTGLPGDNYQAQLEYAYEDDEYLPCTLKRSGVNQSILLDASPEGAANALLWQTREDFEESIVRGLTLRATLLDEDGSELDEPLVVMQQDLGINNEPLVEQLLISEIYEGLQKSDGFFEIAGPPGTSLDGIRISGIRRNGSLDALIDLDGYSLNDDGVFVLSGPQGPPGDLVMENFESFFFLEHTQRSIVLSRVEPDNVEEYYGIDAVGYGDFTGYSFRGEGDPAPQIPSGLSLTREFANTDKGDNSLDFVLSEPTPGEARFWSAE